MNSQLKDKYLNETATASAGGSSSIESAAPEHTIEVINGQDKKTLTEASVPGFKNMSTQGYESDLSDESRMIDEMNAEDDDYNEFGPYGSDGVEEPSETEQAFWDSQDTSEPAGDDIPSDEEIERQMAAWAEEDEERENSSPGAQMKDYVDTVSKEEEQWDRDHPFDDPEDDDLSGMEDEMFGDDYDEDYDPEDDDLSGTEEDYNEFGPYGSDGVEEQSEDEQDFWNSQDNPELEESNKKLQTRVNNWLKLLKESDYMDDDEDQIEVAEKACKDIGQVIKHEFNYDVADFGEYLFDEILDIYDIPEVEEIIEAIIKVIKEEYPDEDDDDIRSELNMMYNLKKFFANTIDKLIAAVSY